MTRKLKPVETALDPELQEAVLSLPVSLPDGTLSTVGALVKQAEDSLHMANEAVQNNALIQRTASFLMKQEKRRGTPSIIVRIDGSAALRTSYAENGVGPSNGFFHSTKLPTIDELRARAETLGVDIDDLGRKKRKIIERLQAHDQQQPPAKLRDEVRESPMPEVQLPERSR